jgi:hypothetical protein
MTADMSSTTCPPGMSLIFNAVQGTCGSGAGDCINFMQFTVNTGVPPSDCCPGEILSPIMYLEWETQAGSTYPFDNPILLRYDFMANSWFSSCYYDAANNCSVFLIFYCSDPINQKWALASSGGGGPVETNDVSTCSPFEQRWNDPGPYPSLIGNTGATCDVGQPQCDVTGHFSGRTVVY